MKNFLKYIRILLNPTKLPFFLLIIVFLLVAFNYRREEQKLPEPEITPSFQYNIKVSYDFKNYFDGLPKKIMLYAIKSNQNTSLNPQKMAVNMDFVNQPKTIETETQNLSIWENGNRQLIYYPNQSRVDYSLYSDASESGKFDKNFSKEKAAEKTQEFLKENGLLSQNLKLDDKEVGFIEVGLYGSRKTTQENATSIKIPYIYTINSYRVIKGDPDTDPIMFFVSPKNEFSYFTYTSFDSMLTPLKEFNLKNQKQVEKELNNGKAFLTFIETIGLHEGVNVAEDYIEKIEIEDIKLSYYNSETYQNFLQPVYVFPCKAKLKDEDKKVECQLLLPAVDQ